MLERAEKDAAFREKLLRDPKSAVELHVGQKLPLTLKVHVREADPNTVYIYLGGSQEAGRDLSDGELEAVSGGWIAPAVVAFVVGLSEGIVIGYLWPHGTLDSGLKAR